MVQQNLRHNLNKGNQRAELLVSLEMVCMSERKGEFREALQRGKDNRFDVRREPERNSFVVVNKGNDAEYQVKVESRGDQLFGRCSCGDFNYRKRVCKHLSEVLTFTLFTV